jgi:hypothetical protein
VLAQSRDDLFLSEPDPIYRLSAPDGPGRQWVRSRSIEKATEFPPRHSPALDLRGAQTRQSLNDDRNVRMLSRWQDCALNCDPQENDSNRPYQAIESDKQWAYHLLRNFYDAHPSDRESLASAALYFIRSRPRDRRVHSRAAAELSD